MQGMLQLLRYFPLRMRSNTQMCRDESQPAYDVVACMLTDVGRRADNQDRILLVNHSTQGPGVLAIVADGMGGERAGQIASQIAVDVIGRHYFDCATSSPAAALRSAYLEANRVIWREAQRNPEWRGMGTTATAVVVAGDTAYVAHVGDSRLYHVSGGQMDLLTQDQTMVAMMLSKNLITKEQAYRHPDRHVLAQALGTHKHVAVIIAERRPIRLGDRLLLCSDGLHGVVDDADICRVITSVPPAEAAGHLLAQALQHADADNISIGILHIVPQHRVPGTVPDTREIKQAMT